MRLFYYVCLHFMIFTYQYAYLIVLLDLIAFVLLYYLYFA